MKCVVELRNLIGMKTWIELSHRMRIEGKKRSLVFYFRGHWIVNHSFLLMLHECYLHHKSASPSIFVGDTVIDLLTSVLLTFTLFLWSTYVCLLSKYKCFTIKLIAQTLNEKLHLSQQISNWISILSLPFMALAPTNYQQQLKLTFCNINISKPRKSLWDKIVIRKELKSYLMAFCEIWEQNRANHSNKDSV